MSSSSALEKAVSVEPWIRAVPEGVVALRRAAGPWEIAAMVFLADARVCRIARETMSVGRSNIAVVCVG